MPIDPDVLLAELTLRGPADSAELVEAIAAPPRLTRTIDGATTLDVAVRDPRRQLLRSGMFDTRSWAVVDDLHFELVQVKKRGNGIDLTFEDAVVAALRRRTDPRTFEAGSATRQQIAAELAAEAGVGSYSDPVARPPVAAAVERSADGQPSSSWEILGTLAEAVGWRRFSNGRRLMMGSDDWLMSLLAPMALREHVGGVDDVDFDLDVGKPTSRATVTVDTTRWAVPPAQPVDLAGMGPGSGRWLVESFTRQLTRTSGTVELVRGQPSLVEPPPEDDAVAAAGDQGELDFLPDGLGGAATAPARTANTAEQRRLDKLRGANSPAAPAGSARSQMVAFAMRQQGKPYVWGASGPDSWDCSGLVQEATRAAGKVLAKPSASQWLQCRRSGKEVGIQQALSQRGALLFRIGSGQNHVAISLGDGRTVEARGTAYGTGVFDRASRGGWTGAALWL